jgi:aspartyl-tRNA(Asn)/glutamyl-tRNA(Gln) amidotransferase subunit B
MNYQTVIGLEVHVQLKTESKIFCPCSTDSSASANTNICPVCSGYPGVLPVFNEKVLRLGIRIAYALNCKINSKIYFERKNYFYPDLPKAYQISQYKMPLGENGYLELPSGRKIGITRVHLEEDAGKLIHKEGYSLVDLNRTGTPLMEIVSDPVIDDPQEAYDYLTYLKLTLQYIGASDCDMEKGSLRCDANISLKLPQADKLGTKIEIKNMNSFKGVREGLSYEQIRQAKALDENEPLRQETRLWDVDKAKTFPMRSKEEAHDYRYFPEPDLLDYNVPDEFIQEEKKFVGEKPLERQRRYVKEFHLGEKEAAVLVEDVWLAKFFEDSLKFFNKPDKISGWLLGPFMEQYNSVGQSGVKISPENFALIVRLFCEDKINNLGVKRLLTLCLTTDDDVSRIIEKEGLAQVSGVDALQSFIDQVVKENDKAVTEYLGGNEKSIMFLVGQVMKKSGGKANPKVAKEMLEKAIKEKH